MTCARSSRPIRFDPVQQHAHVLGWLLTLLVACGSTVTPDAGSDALARFDAPPVLDASPADARFCGGEVCNPISQNGCDPGETRCTIDRSDAPGHCALACVPEGTRDRGDSCEVDPLTGIDTCRAGSVCHPYEAASGTCREICLDGVPCSEGTCELAPPEVFEGPLGVCIEISARGRTPFMPYQLRFCQRVAPSQRLPTWRDQDL